MSQAGAPRSRSHFWLLGALVLGGGLGSALHGYGVGGSEGAQALATFNTHWLQPIGQIFLRLIFMIVVPLVFSALVLGVVELSEHHGVGKAIRRTLMYTIIASTCSVLIGVGLVSFFKPGLGFQIDPNMLSSQSATVEKIQKNAEASKPFSQTLVELIPRNPIDSMARALDGEMIAVMVFALIFGVALGQTKSVRTVELLAEIMQGSMKIVGYAMKLAPLAVFAIVFNTTFRFGTGILGSLGFYAGLVIAGLLIQQFVVYAGLLKFVAKRSPLEFFRACKDVYLYAFSTASSNATLPKALHTAEHELKLSPKTSRFVLTVGATANQNGTALFEGITVLFLAQVYGVDLSFTQQVQVVLMSILAGIGTAGVPGGSLPLIMIVLVSVGVPAEGMAIILGVDRLLDMCRTTLNVSGDLVIAALVSHDSEADPT